jgi:N-methylhydantoinase A
MPANFSAVGILMSDYRDDSATTHVQPLRPDTARDVLDRLAAVVRGATEEIGGFGFDDRGLEILHRADVRYEGQDDTITVPIDHSWLKNEDLFLHGVRERFVAMHRQLFSYGDEHKPLEVVTTRCRTVARVAHPVWHVLQTRGAASPWSVRRVHFVASASFVETPVYDRDSLAIDQVLHGPAIVEEWTTTTVVPPGWSLRTERLGNLILTRRVVD